MIHLAELNEHNICVGTKTVKSMIEDGRHVEIESPDFEYYSWRKFQEDGWSEEKFVPDAIAIEQTTIEKLQKDLDDSVMELSTAISMLMMGGNGDV